jgi:diacylglycerol kinase family enzyme
MHVRCGDYDSHEKYSLICACNGRFYGGGFNPSPTAMLDDGLLDIFIVKKVSLFTFARCVGKYASGHADDFPQFITHLRDTELLIEFDREDVINLDGEGLRAKSVSMKLLPKALNLIVPRGLGHGTELPPLTL